MKIPHEIGLILLCFASASAPLATSEGDDFIGQTLSHDVSREITKGRHEEKGTICLHSINVIPTGEEDTTKPKKVTITSSKKEKNKTKKKHRQKKAAELHASPGCQPTSRWGPQ